MKYSARFAMFFLLSAAVLAQDPLFEFEGDSAGDALGLSVAGPGDITGDGVPDLLVTSPGDDVRKLRAYSGSNGAFLWAMNGGSSAAGFGRSVTALGDVDGDMVGDFAVANNVADYTRVYSGATHTLIRELSVASWTLASMSDLDSDGVRELIVSGNGVVSVFSGASGNLLQSVAPPSPDFGYAISSGGDIDADGLEDFLVGAYWLSTSVGQEAGRAWAYSGATGALLRTFDPSAEWHWFGDQVLGLGDVNADGFGDVLIEARIEILFSFSASYFKVFSGLDGSELYNTVLPSDLGAYSVSATKAPDLDGDGVEDFLISRSGVQSGDSVLEAYSAVTGSLLYAIPETGLGRGSLTMVGDLDGDGYVEALIGARYDSPNGQYSGAARVHRIGPYAPPSTYCVGAPNSVGAGARIAWSGSPSIAHNQLMLSVTGLTPNAFGLFYYGPVQIQLPFGHGFRCVGGRGLGTFRLWPPLNSGTGGSVGLALDLGAPPFVGGAGALAPGLTRNFQFWYRDVPAGLPGFNLSDALAIPFLP